jgi:predicted secreted protein
MSTAISAKGASLRRGATVNTNGTAVTWVSGTQFTNALNAQPVIINGTAYTFTYSSATAGTLSASAGVQSIVPMTAATAVWGEVAEVTAINPSLKGGTQEVTSHQSPGNWKEFIATLKECGVTLDFNFVPTDDGQDASVGLAADQAAGLLRAFSLVFPDNATESLKTRWGPLLAHVTDFQPKAPVSGALTASLTLQITGVPTIA